MENYFYTKFNQSSFYNKFCNIIEFAEEIEQESESDTHIEPDPNVLLPENDSQKEPAATIPEYILVNSYKII